MSKFTAILFGTNQNYETPNELMKKFLEAYNIDNYTQKKESVLSFQHRLRQNEETTIKLVSLKNLDKEYAVCKEADAYIIFVDLECIDALDKLNTIINYIKETCFSDIQSYIIGKYNISEDKIKSLNYEAMKEHLKNQRLYFCYTEVCTEPKNIFMEKIESIFKQILKNKIEGRKNDDDLDDFNSNSKCTIW